MFGKNNKMQKRKRKPNYRELDPEVGLIDSVGMEKLVNFLTVEETEALLLKHIGYNAEEIYKIIGLTNLTAYRKLIRGLNIRVYLYKNLCA